MVADIGFMLDQPVMYYLTADGSLIVPLKGLLNCACYLFFGETLNFVGETRCSILSTL